MTFFRLILLLLLLGGVLLMQYLWRGWVPTLPSPQRWRARLLVAGAAFAWFAALYFIAVQTAIWTPNN